MPAPKADPTLGRQERPSQASRSHPQQRRRYSEQGIWEGGYIYIPPGAKTLLPSLNCLKGADNIHIEA